MNLGETQVNSTVFYTSCSESLRIFFLIFCFHQGRMLFFSFQFLLSIRRECLFAKRTHLIPLQKEQHCCASSDISCPHSLCCLMEPTKEKISILSKCIGHRTGHRNLSLGSESFRALCFISGTPLCMTELKQKCITKIFTKGRFLVLRVSEVKSCLFTYKLCKLEQVTQHLLVSFS